MTLHDKAPLESRYRLPSFAEGFSDWILDTSHMKPGRSVVTSGGVSGELDGLVLRLPSVGRLLGTEG